MKTVSHRFKTTEYDNRENSRRLPDAIVNTMNTLSACDLIHPLYQILLCINDHKLCSILLCQIRLDLARNAADDMSSTRLEQLTQCQSKSACCGVNEDVVVRFGFVGFGDKAERS